jgi:glycosyltransferase involved in cell wall biosynthesis
MLSVFRLIGEWVMNHIKQKSLLFILPLIPYPLRAHGISVRYLPLLEHLSREYALDLIVIGDQSDQTNWVKALEGFCRRVLMVPDPRFVSHPLSEKMRTQLYLLLPWTPPNSSLVYGADRLARDLTDIVAGKRYESVIWVTSHHTAILFPLMRAVACNRLIIDFIDSPTVCLQRRVFSLSPAWLHRYETWKMKHWERRLGREASVVIYISEDDYRLISNDRPQKVRFIANGVSIEGYSPAIAGNMGMGPSIGYIGNMGYKPNVEAVLWLYREIFLPLRRQIPNLALTIIGKNPTAEVRGLAAEEGINVTGAVDEIWPYINGVDVFAFPILRGAGVKNKVLEAMYARRPVVTTPIGNEGINGVSGRDLLVCRHAGEFQEKIGQLLASSERRQEIGEAAHSFVAEKFLWPGILKQFEAAIVGR